MSYNSANNFDEFLDGNYTEEDLEVMFREIDKSPESLRAFNDFCFDFVLGVDAIEMEEIPESVKIASSIVVQGQKNAQYWIVDDADVASLDNCLTHGGRCQIRCKRAIPIHDAWNYSVAERVSVSRETVNDPVNVSGLPLGYSMGGFLVADSTELEREELSFAVDFEHLRSSGGLPLHQANGKPGHPIEDLLLAASFDHNNFEEEENQSFKVRLDRIKGRFAVSTRHALDRSEDRIVVEIEYGNLRGGITSCSTVIPVIPLARDRRWSGYSQLVIPDLTDHAKSLVTLRFRSLEPNDLYLLKSHDVELMLNLRESARWAVVTSGRRWSGPTLPESISIQRKLLLEVIKDPEVFND